MKLKSASPAEGKWHGAKPKKDIKESGKIVLVLSQVSQENSLFVFNEYSLKGDLLRQKIEVKNGLI